jgi:hypothetical protein
MRLTALAAKFTGSSTEAELGAADIQRTALVRDLGIFPTSSSRVAVGHAARAAVCWVISTVATFTAASAVAAWLIGGACVLVVRGG